MKKLLLLGLLLLSINKAFSKHIKGGYIEYRYIGEGSAPNTADYRINVYLFVSCTTSGPTGEVFLGVFDAVTNTRVQSQAIVVSDESTISKKSFGRCISDPPAICYQIYTYTTTINLPNNPNGYILVVQNALRINGIINIYNSLKDGITTFATIPGTIKGVDYHATSSPNFIFDDTALICYKSPFEYKFNAVDPNGDSLSYAFGDGLNVVAAGGSTNNSPPANPPYEPLEYQPGFSGTAPLGNSVTINPVTGVISGIAPATTGVYVVAVYVSQWKNGVLLATTKKELQIDVDNCSLTAAGLAPVYLNCNDFSFTFQNESLASNVASYLWDFGVGGNGNATSKEPTPTYTYADTGTYTLKLTVTNVSGCSDSAEAAVKVYPGFKPNFTFDGRCYQTVFQFKDASYAKYGTISNWSWNFGDPSTNNDTASQQNPNWLYGAPTAATVTLAVSSNKGCTGTATKTVTVDTKPAIYLPFTDTLICRGDTLPLSVQSNGSIFNWGPGTYISDTALANPKVYPNDTTIYTVTVKNKGCIGTASVQVNVLPFINVSLPNNVGICKTDSILLNPVSQALNYTWSAPGNPASLSSSTIKNPKAAPLSTTTYYVTANLGHCQDTARETVYVSPYPSEIISIDTGICYGKSVRLHAATDAAFFSWSPQSTLYLPNTLTPLAGPQTTTKYFFTVKDTFYCTKSVTDSVTITVVPPIQVSAGNDTIAVTGQPIQLTAISNNNSATFSWSPQAYLSSPLIFNPIAIINSTTIDSMKYKVTATTKEGCTGEAYVTIKLYQTKPDIFVPSAFTPNADGKNDVIKPVLAGIATLDYFRVYSRWGQCVFQTSQQGQGWDGTVNGAAQPSGTYVFMAEGKDYLGKTVFKKGSIVLAR
jgi:gliding motility-associated-like protein